MGYNYMGYNNIHWILRVLKLKKLLAILDLDEKHF